MHDDMKPSNQKSVLVNTDEATVGVLIQPNF